MDPRLEAVTGPLKGVVFPITAERVSIGSDPSNELSIYDVSIASTHCLITRHGNAVAVTDLESGQGTFVNGVPVRERILQDSDTLTIGECELVFRNASARAPVQDDKARRNEVFSPLPAPVLRESLPLLPPLVTDVGRMARDLNALFKIANAINSQRDLESLQKGLLQLIFEVVPADAGAIQIIDNSEGQPNSTVTWKREYRDVPEVNVRHELVLRTLWERSEVVADLKVTSTGHRANTLRAAGRAAKNHRRRLSGRLLAHQHLRTRPHKLCQFGGGHRRGNPGKRSQHGIVAG